MPIIMQTRVGHQCAARIALQDLVVIERLYVLVGMAELLVRVRGLCHHSLSMSPARLINSSALPYASKTPCQYAQRRSLIPSAHVEWTAALCMSCISATNHSLLSFSGMAAH